jgi:hypothetical protein
LLFLPLVTGLAATAFLALVINLILALPRATTAFEATFLVFTAGL